MRDKISKRCDFPYNDRIPPFPQQCYHKILMFLKFLRLRKHKKLLRENANFILLDFAEIIDSTLTKFEEAGLIETPLQKEVLKFEITAFVFWLFQKTDVFSELWHTLLLDEVHNQYYDRLKKHGYRFEVRQLVANFQYSLSDLQQNFQRG